MNTDFVHFRPNLQKLFLFQLTEQKLSDKKSSTKMYLMLCNVLIWDKKFNIVEQTCKWTRNVAKLDLSVSVIYIWVEQKTQMYSMSLLPKIQIVTHLDHDISEAIIFVRQSIVLRTL